MKAIGMNELYGSAGRDELERQRGRYERVRGELFEYFGHDECIFFSTPGRCEIIGNHTDHNGGKVIAASIDMDTIAAVATNGTRIIRMRSEGYDGEITVDIDMVTDKDGEDYRKGLSHTEALIAGIVDAVITAGYLVEGFDGCVTSDVIASAGVSSSASFEMLVCSVINELFNDGRMTIKECAKMGQFAENVYWKKNSGLMDQIACAAGGMVYMDFSAESGVDFAQFDLSLGDVGYTLVLVNTGKGHADLSEEYSSIPDEMFEVAGKLGVKRLCETDKDTVLSNLGLFVKNDRAVLRALHFFNENERVERVYSADGDVSVILDAIEKSGHSSWELLQNCYCNSLPQEQRITYALALSREFERKMPDVDGRRGVYRVHGGGFAGVILAVVPDAMADNYIERMADVFGCENVNNVAIRRHGAVRVEM